MPRVVALTTFRDFIVCCCEDGSLWRATWDERNGRFTYSCIHRP